MSGSTTLRSAWLAGVAAVGLVLMGLYPHGFTAARAPAVAVAHPASPTSPGSGTINSTSPSVTFTAANRAGVATEPGDCTSVVVSGTTTSNCSNFFLTVNSPATQVVRVRLDWGSESNDYDLYIFDETTTSQVASSGNGTTTFEDATFTPVAGRTYEVLIVHFAAAPGDNINGSASLVNPPTVTNASRIGPTGTGIVFSRNGNIPTSAGEAPTGKGTVFAKETVRDGEPSIRADVLGNVYPAGIRGVPAGVDVWRYGPNAFCPLFTFHDEAEFADGQDPADGYVWLGQTDGIFSFFVVLTIYALHRRMKIAPWIFYGLTILVKLQEYEEAKSLYESLLPYKIYENEIWHNLGIINNHQGKFTEALALIRPLEANLQQLPEEWRPQCLPPRRDFRHEARCARLKCGEREPCAWCLSRATASRSRRPTGSSAPGPT